MRIVRNWLVATMLASLSSFSSTALAQINTGEISGVVRDSSGGVLPGVDRHGHPYRHRHRRRARHRRRGPLLPPGASHRRMGCRRDVSPGSPRRGIPASCSRSAARCSLDFTLGVQGLAEEVRRRRRRAAPADDDRRDQRRHREPRGRAAAAQRPQLPGARAVERRRRPPAGRHARRGAAAGRAAAQRRRPALGPQHLPARRHEGHRRAVQQPRDQSLGRLDRGVQDPEVDVRGRVRRQGVRAHQRRHARRRRTPSAAASSSSIATTRSIRRTTSSRSASRCRRCGRTSSAARSADRFVRNRSFFFGSFEGLRMKRSLTRTFSVPTAAVRARQLRRLAPDLRSADDPDDGRLHTVREQPDSRGTASTRSPRRCSSTCRSPTAGANLQNLVVGRGTGPGPQSVQRAPRPPAHAVRSAVRALQHVRRRRDPAVRHERPAGDARPGLRALADDDDAEPRREPHARLRHRAPQRAALRLDDGRRAARSA